MLSQSVKLRKHSHPRGASPSVSIARFAVGKCPRFPMVFEGAILVVRLIRTRSPLIFLSMPPPQDGCVSESRDDGLGIDPPDPFVAVPRRPVTKTGSAADVVADLSLPVGATCPRSSAMRVPGPLQ